MTIPVLYMSRLGGLGGGETALLTHVAALDRSKFSPRVICGADGGLVNALEARGIPVQVMPYVAPYFAAGVMPILSVGILPHLYRSLRAHKIQVLHCNDLESAYYAAPLARLLKIPVVWTCWGWWLMERGWKSAFVERWITRIITPTEHIKHTLMEINPKLGERITVIPLGVDTTEFAPHPPDLVVRADFGIAPDAFVITMLARFQAVKGHAVLLDAAPQILDAVPHARFWLIGDAEFDTRDANETRAEIHARIEADARLRAAFVLTGYRDDVPRLLNASDVLICPSDFETYGMAIVEAMACGVPVVCTNIGGPRETMADGETGYLIPPRDPQALAKRVIELARDPQRAREFGANGRVRATHDFDLRVSVTEWQALYTEVTH